MLYMHTYLHISIQVASPYVSIYVCMHVYIYISCTLPPGEGTESKIQRRVRRMDLKYKVIHTHISRYVYVIYLHACTARREGCMLSTRCVRYLICTRYVFMYACMYTHLIKLRPACIRIYYTCIHAHIHACICRYVHTSHVQPYESGWTLNTVSDWWVRCTDTCAHRLTFSHLNAHVCKKNDR